MKQTDWKIIYTKYEGITARAVRFLSKEAGSFLIRECGLYKIHVLPCEKEGCEVSKNAFFVGCYDESRIIKGLVSEDEIPTEGFLVKVTKNPKDEEGRFVILTARSEAELFYAAVSFIDDYIPKYAPACGSNRMPDLIFDKPLTECSYTEKPDHKTRSIFTWGHSINDYRLYLDNMARLKFNELVLWNDYIPLNIEDIISYAHSYGIKVILGYSWGWKEIDKTEEITAESIKRVKDLAISEYRDRYLPVNCDGIYFQTFTERTDQLANGKTIASIVTEMVNDVASELWKINPELRLIFGLHATSVKNHMNEIARVDPRVEILWEDCGEFPFNYATSVKDENEYLKTLEFVKEILHLRGGAGVGLVFKGVMMLNWPTFVYQRGPYVMGENAQRIALHDREVRASSWRKFSADWIESGRRAAEMLRFINENKLGEVNMCLAGTFDGGIYLPVALTAQMYRSLDENYQEILRNVMQRSCITFD